MNTADTIRYQAHKGYSTVAPENTMAAFAAACDAGYAFIELDPKFTADGVCVLIHDWTVNRTGRTPDGRSLPPDTRVDALTLSELEALDFGQWFSEVFRGERIPTFEAAIPSILARGVSVKVDNVWERFSPARQDHLFALVRRLGAIHPLTGARIGMTCAHLENVARVARDLPEAAIHYDGPVTDEVLTSLDTAAAGRELYIWLRFDNEKTAWNKNPPATKESAARVKTHGRLGIWLVDDEEEMPAVRVLAPDVVETNGGVKP